MLAVSNTSPLRYLIAVGHTELLPGLFGELLIPLETWLIFAGRAFASATSLHFGAAPRETSPINAHLPAINAATLPRIWRGPAPFPPLLRCAARTPRRYRPTRKLCRRQPIPRTVSTA